MSETETQYIYRVNLGEYGGSIVVAIYDPERWKPQPGKTRDEAEGGWGGERFGFTADVNVRHVYNGIEAEVNQGSIGSHSPDQAALRIDVYQQAADIARFINTSIALGESMENIAAFLNDTLHSGQPLSVGFVLAR